ncbi:tetratricopeptide repeat protein [Melittangium boletus]|uniref:tetratricopeptide repeat protein n=1 Tax=Melittangium boletus TaxID=83453 RepID=UPI003DA2CA4A
MLDVPHGSTQVLVPRVEDADWLNINRPLFAQRELRVVLFCDTETTIALAQRAVDFFDWISHRVECPVRPPRFAVAGIRTALAVRAPGIIWTGGDLQAAFTAARPRGKLHRVSAALPYSKMVEEIREHPRAWIAWTDVNSHFRMRRVRWAHAETGHYTRAILVEPTVPSPGWWTLHGQTADLREARARLETAGVPFPGRVAALHDLEPAALTKIESSANHVHAADHIEPEDTRLLRDGSLLSLDHCTGHRRLRQRCHQALVTLRGRLAEDASLPLDEWLTWTAWSTRFPRAEAEKTLSITEFAQLSTACSLELALPKEMHTPEKWATLTLQATLLHDLDAAEYWSRRLKKEDGPGAQVLALLSSMSGDLHEAEQLLRDRLTAQAKPLSLKSIERDTLVSTLAAVLERKGKHHEAEELLRAEIARVTHREEFKAPAKNNLLYLLASSLRMQHKHSEAEETIHQAISLHPDQSDEDRANLGRRLNELARILVLLGKLDEAERTFKEALILIGETSGPGHISFTNTLTELFNLLSGHERQGEIESLLRNAIHEIQNRQDEENPNHAKLLCMLASILDGQGDYAQAEKLLNQALGIIDIFAIADHLTNWTIVQRLAHVVQRQGRYAEAERIFRQAVSLAEQAHAEHSNLIHASLLNLGQCLLLQERKEEAKPLLEHSLKLLRAEREHADINTVEGFNMLSVLQSESDPHQAHETAREALNLIATTPGLAQSIPQGLIDSLTALAQFSEKAPEA